MNIRKYKNGSSPISISVDKDVKKAFMRKHVKDRNKLLLAAIKNAIKILPDFYIK